MRRLCTRKGIFYLRVVQPLYLPKFHLHSFALNGLLRPSRPQLSFLQARMQHPITRLISTKTKEWLKQEVKTGLKYSILITVTGFFLVVMASGIQEEYRARIYPTPDEWKWNTRLQFRAAKARENSDDPWMKNWMAIGSSYMNVKEKLQDSGSEGQQIQEQVGKPLEIPVESRGKIGFDVSLNSEPWRRGYYEVLIGLARVAEQLDNCVQDKTKISNTAWPANSVVGPSNPRPRPVPVGMTQPPRENECIAAFEAPEVFYKQILTTRGFTEKQRVDTAISYGLWLDFKGKPESAEKMYKWALDLANLNPPSHQSIVDPSTFVIDNSFGPPSENNLSATTALAVHYATNSKVELALPIFISILRARRSLPEPPVTMLSTLQNVEEDSGSVFEEVYSFVKECIKPPKYPPPPSDGSVPPCRDVKELCEEAGVMLYIGEILYSSTSSKSNKEDGLAWTREAVDIAESHLQQRKISSVKAKETCQQCLEVGLQNWSIMIEKLVEAEENEKVELSNHHHSWLKFGGPKEAASGRWKSEKDVIQDRIVRASRLLNTT